MTNFIKILRSVFRRDTVPWILLVILTVLFGLFAALSLREPTAVMAEANKTDSVYYSSNPEASQENRHEDTVNSRNVKNYVLCIRNGVIAVFEEDGSQPLRTADTPPERLPAADRILLERGVRTDTLAAAYKLLEDYE